MLDALRPALAPVLGPIAMPVLRFATRSYIAGTDVRDALHFAGAAAERGFASTICYWNDGKEEPRVVADRYLASLDRICEARLDAHLSLKIPALWDRRDLVAEVVARARELGITVVFDSHAPDQSDLTFALAEELGAEGLGAAIPGRWTRSGEDVERAIRLGLSVRVVKGQWADPAAPGIDLAQGFLDTIDRLAGRAVHVGVATHDAMLAREAIRRLTAKGTPCTQELLFALPIEPTASAARTAGVPLRLYIPYGSAWLPYSVSRAFENPRVVYWLMRDILTGRRLKLPPPPPRTEA